jgi:ferritin-like metal-binding protein YciE
MAVTEMKDLLKHELGDLLYAERRFTTAMRKMTREIKAPEMRERVERHIEETQGQIERLEQAFAAIGLKPKPEKCEGAIGLREEHDSFKEEEDPSPEMLEAFDLGSGLRVEHYEIAGYRTAIAIAEAMGEDECVRLLTETLREEEAMADFLEKNAVPSLRKLAAAGAEA